MNETIPLEPVDSFTVTTLVDNVTDILLADEGPARRPVMGSVRGFRLLCSMAARRSTRSGPSTVSRRS